MFDTIYPVISFKVIITLLEILGFAFESFIFLIIYKSIIYNIKNITETPAL